jgi:hypothetical protein
MGRIAKTMAAGRMLTPCAGNSLVGSAFSHLRDRPAAAMSCRRSRLAIPAALATAAVAASYVSGDGRLAGLNVPRKS